MKRAGLWMSLAMLLAVLLAASLVAGKGSGARARFALKKDKIAVIPVYGEPQSPDFVVHLLHRYKDDVGVKAVVLAIDSPGGGVAAAQEIVEAIKDLQEDGVFVVAAMGSMAASGCYYIAAPCDRIIANAGTLTGSIGVIMETFNAKKILDKVGLEFEVVKSGEFKDSGGFARGLNPRERALFQGVINDVYGQFLDVVAGERKDAIKAVLAKKSGRPEAGISDAEVKNFVKGFADGRVFSGRQAMAYGLVDELGGLDYAVDATADLAGVEDPEVVTYREPRTLAELLTGVSKAELKSWASSALGARARKFGYYAW